MHFFKSHFHNGMMERAKKIPPLKVEEHGDNDGQSEVWRKTKSESYEDSDFDSTQESPVHLAR